MNHTLLNANNFIKNELFNLFRCGKSLCFSTFHCESHLKLKAKDGNEEIVRLLIFSFLFFFTYMTVK